MNPSAICPQCGTALAALGGLCPACLLKAGVDGTIAAGNGAFVPPPVDELAPLFPQLELLELVGKGGMGAVYKARQKQLDRTVALKILPPGIGADPAFAERFVREAKALAALNHPGIVTIHDFGQADGLFYFVMEFVDGMNLRQLLAGGPIAPREALAIVPSICDALQFAHDHGIIHRDIKPENILLDRRGRVKVADFGLAKIIGGESEVLGDQAAGGTFLTETGKVMGTPSYMAPEQTAQPDAVDHRADIYALGAVLYEMLTGEVPGHVIAPPSQKVLLDVRLDEVVLRALEKQPEQRFQQASIFKTRIERLGACDVEDHAAGIEESRTTMAKTYRVRWRGAVIIVSLLMLLVTIGTAFGMPMKSIFRFAVAACMLVVALFGSIEAVKIRRLGHQLRSMWLMVLARVLLPGLASAGLFLGAFWWATRPVITVRSQADHAALKVDPTQKAADSPAPANPPKPPPLKSVTIEIIEGGSLRVAGEPCLTHELKEKLQALAADSSTRVFLIADSKTSYDQIMAPLNICSDAGFANISFEPNAAVSAAKEWLADIDGGRYEQSWRSADAFLQKSITEAGLSTHGDQARESNDSR